MECSQSSYTAIADSKHVIEKLRRSCPVISTPTRIHQSGLLDCISTAHALTDQYEQEDKLWKPIPLFEASGLWADSGIVIFGLSRSPDHSGSEQRLGAGVHPTSNDMATDAATAPSSANTSPRKVANVPEKKYKCQYCARAFSRSEHRSRHERSHTKERPFKVGNLLSVYGK